MKITEAGIVIPTLTEIYEKKLNSFKAIKPDLREDDSNIIIALLKYDAAEEYELYKQAISVFNNLSVMTAVGNSLNAITTTLGMSWLEGRRASGRIKINCDIGTVIPQAWGVETAGGKKYVTKNDEPFVAKSENIELDVIALITGSINNTSAKTIIKQTEVISGVREIYNENPIINGRDKENDTELRARYLNQIRKKISFTTKGIKEYLLANTDIIDCRVYENDSDITVDGRPPHSYEAVIHGGTEEEIYNALYYYKLAGIRCWGANKKQYGEIEIGYTKASKCPVEVEIIFKQTLDMKLSKVVKKVIGRYIETRGFGDTIYRYIIIGEIYKLNLNLDIVGVKFGKKGALKDDDYTLGDKEVASVTEGDITLRGEI